MKEREYIEWRKDGWERSCVCVSYSVIFFKHLSFKLKQERKACRFQFIAKVINACTCSVLTWCQAIMKQQSPCEETDVMMKHSTRELFLITYIGDIQGTTLPGDDLTKKGWEINTELLREHQSWQKFQFWKLLQKSPLRCTEREITSLNTITWDLEMIAVDISSDSRLHNVCLIDHATTLYYMCTIDRATTPHMCPNTYFLKDGMTCTQATLTNIHTKLRYWAS